MKEKAPTVKPTARREGLVIQELPGEVLVYDLERDRAHCLNETAAFVWQHCDGRKSTAQIARTLGDQFGCEVNEKIVWLALDQLGRNHLLQRPLPRPAEMFGMNRRQVMRSLGIAAVVAVPIVTSIIAPGPAQAASLLPPGSGCSTGAQCISGICNTSGTACGQPQNTCC